jgi:hypothetical protein
VHHLPIPPRDEQTAVSGDADEWADYGGSKVITASWTEGGGATKKGKRLNDEELCFFDVFFFELELRGENKEFRGA